MFCKKVILKNLAKSKGKHLHPSLFFKKVACLRSATSLIRDSDTCVFPWILQSFLMQQFWATVFMQQFWATSFMQQFWATASTYHMMPLALIFIFIVHVYMVWLNNLIMSFQGGGFRWNQRTHFLRSFEDWKIAQNFMPNLLDSVVGIKTL